MKIYSRILIAILSLNLVTLMACSSKTEEKEKDSAAEEKHDSSLIVLKPESQKMAEISTEPVKYRQLASTLEVPGTIQANEDTLTHVGSRITGRVVSVMASLGDHVRKEQRLAIIDSLDLGKAQSEFLTSQARLDVARNAYERAKTLLEGKVIGSGEYQRREGEFRATQAEAQASEDQLHLLGLSQQEVDRLARDKKINSQVAIHAPLNGTIIDRHITMGELVEPAESVFTIADLTKVWGIAEVPEASMAQVKKGLEGDVVVSPYPDEHFHGTVTYISSQLDAETRTLNVRVEVDNSPGKLKPKMFAKIRIKTEGSASSLAIPESAVQRDGNQTVVYVVKGEGYEKRQVELGRGVDGYHEVISGLKAGELIVTKGAFLLKSEELKGQMEEE